MSPWNNSPLSNERAPVGIVLRVRPILYYFFHESYPTVMRFSLAPSTMGDPLAERSRSVVFAPQQPTNTFTLSTMRRWTTRGACVYIYDVCSFIFSRSRARSGVMTARRINLSRKLIYRNTSHTFAWCVLWIVCNLWLSNRGAAPRSKRSHLHNNEMGDAEWQII